MTRSYQAAAWISLWMAELALLGCVAHTQPSPPSEPPVVRVDHLENPQFSRSQPLPDSEVEVGGDLEELDGEPNLEALSAGQAPPAAEGARDEEEAPSPVQIDKEAGEVLVPCHFVNPTRRIEVFACHLSGPTHETVVAFSSRGEELYHAILALGLNPPSFWNATRERELRWNLGDRVLISLRWEWKGKTREVPAEKLLRDPLRDPDLGFSPFIRGFTFSGEKIPLGEPPQLQIPGAVEITIGDPTRQSLSFKLLFHPNDLEELTPWMGPLDIDPKALPDLEALVSEKVPATLVIRRLAGEAELLSMARRFEKEPERLELLSSLAPLAEEIDARKSSYAAMVKEMQALLEKGGDPAKLAPEERDRIAGRLVKLQKEGHLEAARLRHLYFKVFDAQEKFKAEAIRQLGKELEPEVLQATQNRYAHGLAYETRLAAIDVELSRLEAAPQPLSEKDELLRQALHFDQDVLLYERDLFWNRNELESVRQRMKELAPADHGYTLKLFQEEEGRVQAEIRQIQWKIEEVRTRAEENRLRASGEWLARRDQVVARRKKALLGIELGELESKRVELLADLRWKENDLEKDQDNPEKLAQHRASLKELKEQKKALEEQMRGKKAEFDGMK
ncbi:MAG: hypothetical protein HY717_02330 [Planctomycetes bacterium]|nr:hypothetical protein [Planctomycetota bacterium]